MSLLVTLYTMGCEEAYPCFQEDSQSPHTMILDLMFIMIMHHTCRLP